MNKNIKILLKAINYIIVSMVILLAFLLVGIRFFGFELYTVLSGSMEPNYHIGSLVYVKEVDQKELKKGDVITFYLTENTIVTHRIIEVIEDEKTKEINYRTKGDANEIADGKLTPNNNVIGEVIFSIPLLGYFSNFIQRPVGSFITIVVGLLLIVLVFAIDYITDNQKKIKKKMEVKDEKKGSNNN